MIIISVKQNQLEHIATDIVDEPKKKLSSLPNDNIEFEDINSPKNGNEIYELVLNIVCVRVAQN